MARKYPNADDKAQIAWMSVLRLRERKIDGRAPHIGEETKNAYLAMKDAVRSEMRSADRMAPFEDWDEDAAACEGVATDDAIDLDSALARLEEPDSLELRMALEGEDAAPEIVTRAVERVRTHLGTVGPATTEDLRDGHYLGKLCNKGHRYQGRPVSVRFTVKKGGGRSETRCVECHRFYDRRRKERQHARERAREWDADPAIIAEIEALAAELKAMIDAGLFDEETIVLDVCGECGRTHGACCPGAVTLKIEAERETMRPLRLVATVAA